MLVKMYGESREQKVEKRYSPAKYVSSTKKVVFGGPGPKYISTSFVERNNLTMRMGMRRFTRLIDGFPQKAENPAHAVSLHFMYCNFVRIHQGLQVSPAMEAGITDHLGTLKDIAKLAG